MAFGVGYNFSANTLARASQVNENFAWFRGTYLPITQSNTWANTNSIYDLGSSSFHWANAYVDNLTSCSFIFTTNLRASSITATSIDCLQTITCADLTATNITCESLTATTITVAELTATTISVTESITAAQIIVTGTLTAANATITNLTVATMLSAAAAKITILSTTTFSVDTMAAGRWPSFMAYRTGDQEVVTVDTAVKIKFTAEEYDTNSNFSHDGDDSGGATESRFTPTIAGKYLLIANILITAGVASQDFTIFLNKNGAAYKTSESEHDANGSLKVMAIADANGSTDYFDIAVQANGSVNNYTIKGAQISVYFNGSRIA